MPGTDRRYKLLKDGLPGPAGFAASALSSGAMVDWDGSSWQISASIYTTTRGINVVHSAGDDPAIFLRDNSLNQMSFIGFSAGDGNLYMSSQSHGSSILLYGENVSGTNTQLAEFDPDGFVTLYESGDLRFSTAANSVRAVSNGSSAATGFNYFGWYGNDNSTRWGWIGYGTGDGNIELRNEVTSGLVQILSDNSGGSATLMASFDPDGSGQFYHTGIKAFQTANHGLQLFDTNGTNPYIAWYTDDLSTRNGFIQAGSGGFLIECEVHGIPLQIRNEDAGGTNRVMIETDGDVGTAFEYLGIKVGAPTGGFKGTGTINATAVYDDNVLLCQPVEDAIGVGDGREAWDRMAPDGHNRLADQYEQDRREGWDGTRHGWKAMMERRGSVPGLPNRAELEPRYVRTTRIVEKPEGIPDVEIEQDNKLSIGERTERMWLALDYMAVALRDALNKIDELEDRLNGSNPSTADEPSVAGPRSDGPNRVI